MDDWQSKSYWLSQSGAYTPNAPLEGDLYVDVAIIGGGFTGLATAYYLKRAAPTMRVAVLESQVVGFGASGRNAAFAMTVFGLSLSITAMLHGKDKTRESFAYMQRAVDNIGTLVEENGIDCDYERPGFLRMATTPGYVKRIHEEIELAHELGFDEIEWIDQDQARAQVHSERYLGAWWEPHMALINPVKMARGMKAAAEKLGVEVYEQTPVQQIRRNGKFTITTAGGEVKANKVAFATNAYSHLFSQIKRKQVPAFTYIVLTQPLEERHFQEIGWRNRQGVEDARNLIHYYRLTKDNRLLMGGGPVGLGYGDNMEFDRDTAAFQHLEDFIAYTFPALRDVPIAYRWGGPFSVTLDLTPAMGYVGDERAVYSVGCIGHGVSTTHMNGQVLRDLLLEAKTDLTSLWFVNRKTIPWPPEPFRLAAEAGLRAYLQGEDAWYERGEKIKG